MTVTELDDGKRSVMARMFDVLDCFMDGEEEQTISSICKQTGLATSTVHRMLTSLVEWGAVVRHERGRYQLGRRLWNLGSRVPEVRVWQDLTRPVLVDLWSEAGTPVALTRRDGDVLRVVDYIAGQDADARWRPTRPLPLGCIAPGLVHLAHMSPDSVGRLIAMGRAGFTGEIRRDHAAAARLLERVRRVGVAMSRARTPGGAAWVSAPILGPDKSVRATMSVIVPDHELEARKHAEFVMAAARRVSDSLADPAALRSVRAPTWLVPARAEDDALTGSPLR